MWAIWCFTNQCGLPPLVIHRNTGEYLTLLRQDFVHLRRDIHEVAARVEVSPLRDRLYIVILVEFWQDFDAIEELLELIRPHAVAIESSQVTEYLVSYRFHALIFITPLRAHGFVAVDAIQPKACLRLVDYRVVVLAQFFEGHADDMPALLHIFALAIDTLAVVRMLKNVNGANAFASASVDPTEPLQERIKRGGIGIDRIQVNIQTDLNNLRRNQYQRLMRRVRCTALYDRAFQCGTITRGKTTVNQRNDVFRGAFRLELPFEEAINILGALNGVGADQHLLPA